MWFRRRKDRQAVSTPEAPSLRQTYTPNTELGRAGCLAAHTELRTPLPPQGNSVLVPVYTPKLLQWNANGWVVVTCNWQRCSFKSVSNYVIIIIRSLVSLSKKLQNFLLLSKAKSSAIIHYILQFSLLLAHIHAFCGIFYLNYKTKAFLVNHRWESDFNWSRKWWNLADLKNAL